MRIREQLQSLRTSARKGVAVLIDPDKLPVDEVEKRLAQIIEHQPEFIFAGGSLITCGDFSERMAAIHKASSLPVVLFPGSPTQVTPHADGLLFLSLISGRNAELLIGHHVTAAAKVKQIGIEAVATGYMLIDGGRTTTASYISNTTPIPRDKAEIAAATALAGELLGMHCIYLDAGSGADLPVPLEMISAVRSATDLPLIVGGGMRTKEQINSAHKAGADLVVIGTAIEENPELIAGLL